MPITVGLTGHAESVVSRANTAAAVGSGLVPVFATPFMIALMENAAVNAVQPQLNSDEGTVGTHLNVSHDDATPIGMKVWADAEITAVHGKKITYFVRAFDESGPIGGGVHERCIISLERFLSKTQEKCAREGYEAN